MGGKTISTSETKIEALQLQSSAYGVTVPLVYGLAQIPGNLVWYGGFKATPHTSSQGAGGKGGVKTQNTTYSYSASIEMGLCHGVINGIPRVWRGKEQFYGGVTPAQLLSVAEVATAAFPGSFTVAHAAAWRATVSVISAGTGSGENFQANTYLAEGVHYTVAAGVYTWLAAAAGMVVTVTYQYATGTVTQSALAQLALSFLSGLIGQAAWSPLSTLAPTQAIGYSGLALVAGQDYQLGTGAQVDNHLFEVQGPMAYSVSSTTPDADPADIVADVLLNARYGAGLPAERLASLVNWGNYNRSARLICSPAITEQLRAADLVTLAARLTNTAPVWSAGRLKMVPYGDESIASYGRSYTPNVTPLYDLTDDHYLDAETPVDVQSKPPSERYNHFRIEFRNRGGFDSGKQVFVGQYAIEVAEAKDQADIEANGLRSAPIEQMHWICDGLVAQTVAYLLLYRSLFVTNTYSFRLPWTFSLVEPMDLLTLTDAAQGLNKLPVRVISRQEDDSNTLTFAAEDFPLGIAGATLYANTLGDGFAHDYNAIPGSISTPVIFEAPGALVPTTGLEVYVAATGTGANWGGCRVWVSLDGVTYKEVGRLLGGSRYGALTGAISGGALPVTILTGQLLSGSSADATQLSTLCFVGGSSPEYLAHTLATLTGAQAYSLSVTVRGAYLTANAGAHAAADPFVRVDDAIAKSGALDLRYIGTTVHVKCTSFNVYGGAEESLGAVTDYTYVITGARVNSLAQLAGVGTNLVANPAAESGAVLWAAAESTGTLATFTADTSDKAGGSASFRITKASTGDGYARSSLAFPVIAGETYNVKVKVKGSSATGSGLYVRMSEKASRPSTGYIGVGSFAESDARDSLTDLVTAGPVPSAWTGYDFNYTVPAGVFWVSLTIYDWIGGPTSLWFDDCVVARVTSTQGIAAAAATEVFTDDHDFAGAAFGTTTARSFVVTPSVDGIIEFTATVAGRRIDGDSGSSITWTVTPAGGSLLVLGRSSSSSSALQAFVASTAFACVAGVALTFEIKTNKGGFTNVELDLSTMRVTLIKR